MIQWVNDTSWTTIVVIARGVRLTVGWGHRLQEMIILLRNRVTYVIAMIHYYDISSSSLSISLFLFFKFSNIITLSRIILFWTDDYRAIEKVCSEKVENVVAATPALDVYFIVLTCPKTIVSRRFRELYTK